MTVDTIIEQAGIPLLLLVICVYYAIRRRVSRGFNLSAVLIIHPADRFARQSGDPREK